MNFFFLTCLLVLFSTNVSNAQETIVITGDRISGAGGTPATAFNPGGSKPERCLDENCGEKIEPVDQSGGGAKAPISSFSLKEELKLSGMDLLNWLRKMWQLKSVFGRTNFLCRADIVCQSPTDIGLTCKAIGTYLTADEAYNKFSHDSCCEREGKGHQIGVNWNNCSLY